MTKLLPLTLSLGMLFTSFNMPAPTAACPCGDNGVCSKSCGSKGSCCSHKASTDKQVNKTSVIERKVKLAKSAKTTHS